MTQLPLSQARNKDLPASFIALRRAGRLAREQAVRTDTAIIVLRGHSVVRVTAAELREAGIR